MFIDYGNAFSWSLCPRAQVFGFLFGWFISVFSFEIGLQARSFQSEGFGRDEEDSKIKQVSDRSVSSVCSCFSVFFFCRFRLSLGSATGQISSRADLNSPWNNHTFAPFGGIDCKITDDEMIRRMETVAVCGPT